MRDLAEMFLERSFVFTHETVWEWEAKLAPSVADKLRKRHRGVVGESWYVDETYIKIDGRWCYLYRATDRNGHLVDVRLSKTRDLAAAKGFIRSGRAVTGVTPARVTSDGHGSFPRAIACELGEDVTHRTNRYLNNHLEQDHRGINQRVRPMRGFKRFTAAARFRLAHDELPNFLCPTTTRSQPVSLARHRLMHTRRLCVLTRLLKAN